jgi:hypothetical protein
MKGVGERYKWLRAGRLGDRCSAVRQPTQNLAVMARKEKSDNKGMAIAEARVCEKGLL